MRKPNVERMRRMVTGGSHTIIVEEIEPQELTPGDRILVEMEVVARVNPVPGTEVRDIEIDGRKYVLDHVKARVPRESLWHLGDQEAWTWGWPSPKRATTTRIVR